MSTDVVIIGAGIVGLATAYQLLKINPHLKIAVLEKECKAALHQSSRNSGVIHSGVYYKPGSLKAKNCVEGKKELTEFCERQDISIKALGKVIVATEQSEIPYLEELERRGKANRIGKLELIDPKELKEIEPHASAVKALWIPGCSVVDFSEVVHKLCKVIKKLGAVIVFEQKVKKVFSNEQHVCIVTENAEYHCKKVINCAGLFSDRLVCSNKQNRYKIIPFRGEYYEIMGEKKNLVRGLIYPVKDPRFPFLGIHLTRMINGKVEAGPNAVLALAREGYTKSKIQLEDVIDIFSYKGFWKMALKYWKMGAYEMYRSFSKKAFLKDIQKIIPSMELKDLRKSSSGVRAQVVLKDGTMPDDFLFREEENILHVINAPSPAATASFSIGKHIADKILATWKI